MLFASNTSKLSLPVVLYDIIQLTTSRSSKGIHSLRWVSYHFGEDLLSELNVKYYSWLYYFVVFNSTLLLFTIVHSTDVAASPPASANRTILVDPVVALLGIIRSHILYIIFIYRGLNEKFEIKCRNSTLLWTAFFWDYIYNYNNYFFLVFFFLSSPRPLLLRRPAPPTPDRAALLEIKIIWTGGLLHGMIII